MSNLKMNLQYTKVKTNGIYTIYRDGHEGRQFQ